MNINFAIYYRATRSAAMNSVLKQAMSTLPGKIGRLYPLDVAVCNEPIIVPGATKFDEDYMLWELVVKLEDMQTTAYNLRGGLKILNAEITTAFTRYLMQIFELSSIAELIHPSVYNTKHLLVSTQLSGYSSLLVSEAELDTEFFFSFTGNEMEVTPVDVFQKDFRLSKIKSGLSTDISWVTVLHL